MWRRTWLLALILLGAQASPAEPRSSPPPDTRAPDYRAPDTQGLCPQLAQDYELCTSDPWSGNCAEFVTAAGRLGKIYRSELRAHPGWASDLQTTIWWGCGTAELPELRSLLERIGTPEARAVLAEEPYASLAEPRAPARPPLPPQELDCEAPSTPAERDGCAARNLAQAKAEHERAVATCRKRVAPELRQELVGAEASWEKLLPLECTGTGEMRDECLAQAYEERTRSISSLHPECAAAGPD